MSIKWLNILFRNLLLFLIILSFTGCATMKKPLTGIVAGREAETLQSPISVSVKSGQHTTSGRGYLIFKKPDRFHMALLSPFGLTVFEVFIDGDRITCLLPSKGVAYRGLFSELPPTSPLQSMVMMRWVQQKPPTDSVAPSTRELTAPSGDRYFLNGEGLVVRKVSPLGDEALYEDYAAINGVAFPETLIINSRVGTSVKIVFDEPQIDQPVEDTALTPNLESFTIQPLADFKGF